MGGWKWKKSVEFDCVLNSATTAERKADREPRHPPQILHVLLDMEAKDAQQTQILRILKSPLIAPRCPSPVCFVFVSYVH